jgi:beta-lactamase regulating signal transducer with metallopeptidase domain
VLQYVLPATPLALLQFPQFLFEDGAGARFTSLPLATWIAMVWFTGAVLLLARCAHQMAGVRRLARAAVPVPAGRLPSCIRAGDPPACVRYSPAVASPVTFGWWRPTILLPPEARGWPAEWLASALSHELAHVRRRDYLVLVLTEVLRALYWPNPLIWRVTTTVRAELEHACDDAVLRGGASRVEYARHLLQLATCQRTAPTAGALSMVRRSLFRERMRAILEDGADRAPVSRHVLVAAGVVWLLLVGGLGGAGLWRCSAQAAPPAAANVSDPGDRPPAG